MNSRPSETVNVAKRGATLEDYARAINLPINYLQTLGLNTVDNPWIDERKALAIPYRLRNGRFFRNRLWQTANTGESKAIWDKRQDRLGGLLYGLDLLPASGCPLILTDSESNCHMLWYHGFDAVGVAGATGYYIKRDDAELAEFTIMMLASSGEARSELLKRLSLSKHRQTIKVLPPIGNLKTYHQQGTSQFCDALNAALAEAETLDSVLSREMDLDARKTVDGADMLGGNVADNLVTLARRHATFFSAPDETTWGAVHINTRRETWSLRSKGFRTWLVHQYFRATQKAPNAEALNQSLLTLDAVARYEGDQRMVFIRTAEHDGKYYVDLADDGWQVVEIDTEGWRVVSEAPVYFRRPRGMLPLPTPVSGGTIGELRSFLNLSEDADFTLIVAWLLAALRPKGPYPLLALAGEPGAAKSTTASILRNLVDPNVANLRSTPREERDCWIAANNAGLLAFDNLSRIPNWLSDALCRIATGGGYATRELHTNDDEMLFDVIRPTLLTAVSEVIARSDLADRAIMIELPTIPNTQRVDEERFKSAFLEAKPRIFGALLDAMVIGLRNRPNVTLEKLPRLADFAIWASACEPAYTYPNGFMEAYTNNAIEAVMGVIEGDAVCVALLAFMKTQGNAWQGRPEDLLTHLNNFAPEGAKREKGWPRNPQAMSGCLQLALPSLRKISVSINRRKSHGVRTIEILQE